MAIFLGSTTSLQAVLAGAKNTNDCSVVTAYIDEPTVGASGPSAACGATFPTTTNGVTAVTLAAAPQQTGYRRRVNEINLFNADLAAVTVSIQFYDSATAVTTVLQKVTLQTLEMLNYVEGYGFQALDVNGAVKSQAAATSSATSTAQSGVLSVSVNLSTANSTLTIVSSLQSGASVQSFTSTTFSTISSTASNALSVSVQQSGASVQSFTSSNWSTVSSAASNGLLVSTQVSGASVQSFTSSNWSTVSLTASGAVVVSSLQSGASAQSFTSTTFSTVSSGVSRVKSSFGW